MIQKVVFPQKKQFPLKRTAAYARVSSGKDAMLHSLSAQVSYYNQLIQSNPEWLFCGVYADEALTGTKGNRAEFQKLLNRCRQGEIDLILTKSISRFARNTGTLLETVRELKTLGVDVYFEEQRIHSMSSDGELLLSILASYAQEESYSASENRKWQIRKDFSIGKIGSITILGYRRNAEGVLEIEPNEAELVRMIFSDYISGMGQQRIANKINEMGIPTRQGNLWTNPRIREILTNEKYKGSALLQKRFTVDFLTKKTKVNEGEVPQYYIEESHTAIISPEEFEEVQAEISRRKKLGRKYSGNTIFSAKLVCGDCGSFFGSKVWHSTSKYRRIIWQCNNKFKWEHLCSTPHLYEDEIKLRFITAFAEFFQKKDVVLETCHMLMEELADTLSLAVTGFRIHFCKCDLRKS